MLANNQLFAVVANTQTLDDSNIHMDFNQIPQRYDSAGPPQFHNYSQPMPSANADPTASSTSSNAVAIENLELSDLLKNKHVSNLFDNFLNANRLQLELTEENLRLNKMVEELKRVPTGMTGFHLDTHRNTPARSLTTSLAPSDSISQNPSFTLGTDNEQKRGILPSSSTAVTEPPLLLQPAVRPSQYPVSILWTIEDCKADGLIKVSPSNPSRIPMEFAIRHPDGSVVSRPEWNLIKAAVRMVNSELRALPAPNTSTTGPSKNARARRTKTWFLQHYRHEWNLALARLEYQQPLVGLCAVHWKADHLLQTSLQTSSKYVAKDTKEPREIESTDLETDDRHRASTTGSGSNKRSKEVSSTSLRKGRKKRRRNEDPQRDIGPSSQDVTMRDAENSSGKDSTPSTGTNTSAHTMPPPSWPASSITHRNPEPRSRSDVGTMRRKPLATSSFMSSLKKPPVDKTGFIDVNPSCENLANILSIEFPSITAATALLPSMMASPGFQKGDGISAPNVLALISRIEAADPNSPDISEDEKGISWGHYQFTAGGMTIATTLASWEAIGNVQTACRLIAAAIKTCKVAHYICFTTGSTSSTSNLLANVYLQNTVEKLWDLWKEAGGPIFKGKSRLEYSAGTTVHPLPPASSLVSAATSRNHGLHSSPQSSNGSTPPQSLVSQPPQSSPPGSASVAPSQTTAFGGNTSSHYQFPPNPPAAGPSSSVSGLGLLTGTAASANMEQLANPDRGSSSASIGELQSLTKEELKGWIKSSALPLSGSKHPKSDLLNCIMNAPLEKQPSPDDVARMKRDRKTKQAVGRNLKAPTSTDTT